MLPNSKRETPVTSAGGTAYQPYKSFEEFGPGQVNTNSTVVFRRPIEDEEEQFTKNQEERCPILLCLDHSGSMQGAPISELRQALDQFRADLLEDPIVAAKVDVGLVTFNNMIQIHDFVNATTFQPPNLTALGGTNMAFAMQVALDLCEKRKDSYREHGIAYHRPWIILITDGYPDHDTPEEILQIHQRITSAEETRRAAVFTVACGDDSLTQWLTDNITPPGRPAKRTSEANFKDLFKWLSNSQIALSKSAPGERTQLPSTDGWEIA